MFRTCGLIRPEWNLVFSCVINQRVPPFFVDFSWDNDSIGSEVVWQIRKLIVVPAGENCIVNLCRFSVFIVMLAIVSSNKNVTFSINPCEWIRKTYAINVQTAFVVHDGVKTMPG